LLFTEQYHGSSTVILAYFERVIQKESRILTSSLDAQDILRPMDSSSNPPPYPGAVHHSPVYPNTVHLSPRISANPPPYVDTNDLEAQQTQNDGSPPPSYLPPFPKGPKPKFATVPYIAPIQRQGQSGRSQRKGLCCGLLMAFLVVAIFIITTIVEVVARVSASRTKSE